VPPTGAGTGTEAIASACPDCGATHGRGDRNLPGSRKVEAELHPFSGDHRERVPVERTPFPAPGTVLGNITSRDVPSPVVMEPGGGTRRDSPHGGGPT
jgi:hypothetical protein